MSSEVTTSRRKPRNLALKLVEVISQRIRGGSLAVGEKLPTEADIMREFSVSRTVVREALSKLQASGLVETRHGIGTFVVDWSNTEPFHVSREQLRTLRDVVALLELRIGLETEAAGLAAQRRTPENLESMRSALSAFTEALAADGDAVGPDFQFHLEIARATQNAHFIHLMNYLGDMIIPRSRLGSSGVVKADRQDYLLRVNSEHESILNAIANQDPEAARAAVRTHLANSRERRRRATAAAESQS